MSYQGNILLESSLLDAEENNYSLDANNYSLTAQFDHVYTVPDHIKSIYLNQNYKPPIPRPLPTIHEKTSLKNQICRILIKLNEYILKRKKSIKSEFRYLDFKRNINDKSIMNLREFPNQTYQHKFNCRLYRRLNKRLRDIDRFLMKIGEEELLQFQ